MFQQFYRKSSNLLGIDLAPEAIRVVELTSPGIIKNYIIESFLPSEPIYPALTRALNKLNPATQRAIVAMPASAVMTRTAQFPAELSQAELAWHVQLEAEQHIPYALDEINMDYQVVSVSKDRVHINVLIIICKKEQLGQRVNLLTSVGLNVVIVDVDTYAIVRAFIHSMPNCQETIALIHIESSGVMIILIKDQIILYQREHLFDYSFLLEQLQFLSATVSYPPIERLILMGNILLSQQVAIFLKEKTHYAVQPANFFENISLSNQVSASLFDQEASALIVSFGLALRNPV